MLESSVLPFTRDEEEITFRFLLIVFFVLGPDGVTKKGKWFACLSKPHLGQLLLALFVLLFFLINLLPFGTSCII